ncbi:hypothetical protein ACI0YR_003929 [Cronobacter dublinensis]
MSNDIFIACPFCGSVPEKIDESEAGFINCPPEQKHYGVACKNPECETHDRLADKSLWNMVAINKEKMKEAMDNHFI